MLNFQDEALISVIIPVYNVETYLSRCVDSVLRQTYGNLEIWLVDDGSSDGCPGICDGYADKDDRIRVIHKENGGASEARNRALDQMSGEYVLFVDADDFIHESLIAVLYKVLKKCSADMAASRIKAGTDNAFDEKMHIDPDKYEKKEGDDRFTALFDERYRSIMSAACAKLYRREIFKSVRFPVGKGYEDEFTIHHLLNCCKSIVLSDNELYYHFARNGSSTRAGYTLKSLEAVEAVEDRCSFFENYGNRQLICLCFREYLRRVQFHYYSLKKYYPDETERIQEIKDNYKKRYAHIMPDLCLKDRMRFGLFIWMPSVNRILKEMAGARKI